ncbi:MAG: gamma-glutamyltransferase, partial [Verrucomicrobiota bacterium]
MSEMLFRHKLLILLTMAAAAVMPGFASVDPAPAQHGMVVSAHDLASQAGVEIMRAGGNAVDAAV